MHVDVTYVGEGEEGINNVLSAMENYYNQWKMEVNTNMTKVEVLGRGRVQTEGYNFTSGNERVETRRI